MKSRGLEPVTWSVYGPTQETASFRVPLIKLLASVIRSLFDWVTVLSSNEFPVKKYQGKIEGLKIKTHEMRLSRNNTQRAVSWAVTKQL